MHTARMPPPDPAPATTTAALATHAGHIAPSSTLCCRFPPRAFTVTHFLWLLRTSRQEGYVAGKKISVCADGRESAVRCRPGTTFGRAVDNARTPTPAHARHPRWVPHPSALFWEGGDFDCVVITGLRRVFRPSLLELLTSVRLSVSRNRDRLSPIRLADSSSLG